ncbi:MAG: homoserine kinase [Lactobacillales bacterium]|jgi:homoserine kinase|nr:homoserine kinase [Lactobacillales bacterium]
MRIRVPATSANLGPGFDSCGIALNRYLTVKVNQPATKWEICHSLGSEVPTDDRNLLIQTALKIEPTLSPHIILMDSDIPQARGLGSSSSVIIAGIELANQLGDLKFTRKRIIEIATEMEGHPDNVAPAVLGNFVLASFVDRKVESVVQCFPEVGMVGFIPDFELFTSVSRGVLPTQMSYKDAVAASSIANVMIGALLSGNLELAGKMIEKDLFHEKYREKLVTHIHKIREYSQKFGAYATYLSGAGPTTITLLPLGQVDSFAYELEKMNVKGQVEKLEIDCLGLQTQL